jgi:hypothetical protein
MDKDTEKSLSSSAKAAKEARGKETSSLSHEDVVYTPQLAIDMLEEMTMKPENGAEELEASCSGLRRGRPQSPWPLGPRYTFPVCVLAPSGRCLWSRPWGQCSPERR